MELIQMDSIDQDNSRVSMHILMVVIVYTIISITLIAWSRYSGIDSLKRSSQSQVPEMACRTVQVRVCSACSRAAKPNKQRS